MNRKVCQHGSFHRGIGASMIIGTAATAILSAPLHAEFVEDVDIVVPGVGSHFVIDVEFIGSSAGWSGDLYFLGSGTSDEVENSASNTNDAGLGQWLLNNHSSTAGDTVTLNGVFESGEVIHLAYDVWRDGNHQDLFRTDLEEDAPYFQWDDESLMLGIEDIRGDGSDWDFNDIEVSIAFRQVVPTPATAAIMGIAGLCGFSGRRRRS